MSQEGPRNEDLLKKIHETDNDKGNKVESHKEHELKTLLTEIYSQISNLTKEKQGQKDTEQDLLHKIHQQLQELERREKTDEKDQLEKIIDQLKQIESRKNEEKTEIHNLKTVFDRSNKNEEASGQDPYAKLYHHLKGESKYDYKMMPIFEKFMDENKTQHMVQSLLSTMKQHQDMYEQILRKLEAPKPDLHEAEAAEAHKAPVAPVAPVTPTEDVSKGTDTKEKTCGTNREIVLQCYVCCHRSDDRNVEHDAANVRGVCPQCISVGQPENADTVEMMGEYKWII